MVIQILIRPFSSKHGHHDHPANVTGAYNRINAERRSWPCLNFAGHWWVSPALGGLCVQKLYDVAGAPQHRLKVPGSVRPTCGRRTFVTARSCQNWHHSVALFARYWNGCWRHTTTRQTPAQANKLTDHAWTIAELREKLSTIQPPIAEIWVMVPQIVKRKFDKQAGRYSAKLTGID